MNKIETQSWCSYQELTLCSITGLNQWRPISQNKPALTVCRSKLNMDKSCHVKKSMWGSKSRLVWLHLQKTSQAVSSYWYYLATHISFQYALDMLSNYDLSHIRTLVLPQLILTNVHSEGTGLLGPSHLRALWLGLWGVAWLLARVPLGITVGERWPWHGVWRCSGGPLSRWEGGWPGWVEVEVGKLVPKCGPIPSLSHYLWPFPQSYYDLLHIPLRLGGSAGACWLRVGLFHSDHAPLSAWLTPPNLIAW